MGEPILTRWLEGASLESLGASEHDLRVELAEMQGHVTEVMRQRNAFNEDARKLNQLLGAWSQQFEKTSLRFGEWAPSEFYRGYLCGHGAMARTAHRTLELLGNVVRMRAYYSGGGDAVEG